VVCPPQRSMRKGRRRFGKCSNFYKMQQRLGGWEPCGKEGESSVWQNPGQQSPHSIQFRKGLKTSKRLRNQVREGSKEEQTKLKLRY